MSSFEIDVQLTPAEAGARILEMSYLCGLVAPVYSKEHRAACRAALGQDLAIVLPTLLSDLGRLAMKDIDAAMPYVRFLHEASSYCLGFGAFPQVADEPKTEMRRKVRRALKSMRLEALRPE